MERALYLSVKDVDQAASLTKAGQSLLHCHIDAPVKGSSFAGKYIFIEGWCFHEKEAVQRISAAWLELQLPLTLELGIARPDVESAYQNQQSLHSGFQLYVYTNSIPESEFSITLFAHSVSGIIHPIGQVNVVSQEWRRRRSFRGSRTELIPIGIASSGRSGTTLLMRFLHAHPQVVVEGNYPFERDLLNRGISSFKKLTLPTTHDNSYAYSKESITKPYINLLQVASRMPRLDSDEGKWLLDAQAETARYVKTCVDLFYKRLAIAQGKRPKAFAEKLLDFNHQYIDFLEMYDNAHIIVLVRDPRDKLVSQLAFDRKRKLDGGWYLGSDGTLGSFLYHMKEQMWMSTQILHRFPKRATEIRYEDLLIQPHAILRSLFERLSLKNDRATLTKIVEEVDRTNPEYVHHMTATQPQESIRRWKTQLDAEVAATFSFFLEDELKAFRYEIETAAKPPTEDVWRRELTYGKVLGVERVR
jgi:LPS sulfotransferase NodH